MSLSYIGCSPGFQIAFDSPTLLCETAVLIALCLCGIRPFGIVSGLQFVIIR
ncbi:MAG: hypothetical protein GY803_04865 [Chloroflexi bacterium]|nr:hypothetical protein [Chloroflexota bacterium]